MQPLLGVPEGLVVVETVFLLATALILPRLSKVEELRWEAKDRTVEGSEEVAAMGGDGVAQGIEGGRTPADRSEQGDEEWGGSHM